MDTSKKLYYNGIIMIKAGAIGVWFYAVQRLLQKVFPDSTWESIFIMIVFSIIILLWDDGMLSELHSLKPSTIAAITNTNNATSKNNIHII